MLRLSLMIAMLATSALAQDRGNARRPSDSAQTNACDHATSGAEIGACAWRLSQADAVKRDARLNAMVARLPRAAGKRYPPAKRAFETFIDRHGPGETDVRASLSSMFVTEEKDKARDQFALDMSRLVAGRWPRATAAEAKAADAQLNASYRKALAWAAGDTRTTIKAEDIRATQRAWLVYRDAFSRFAAASGKASTNAVLARLTKLRTAQLDAVLLEGG